MAGRKNRSGDSKAGRVLSTAPPPPPPDFLDAVGKAKWRELAHARAFRPHELDQLAAYCAAYARWQQAEQWLSDPALDANGNPTRGPVAYILDDKGNIRTIVAAPQIAIAEKASKEMARIAKLLRLNSRRSR